ncbi:MAG: site-2 protease family protein [Betaproteobacteria bacterium]|nr:site-2 protease family protein [Betaproteobacteria bacterium]
MNNGWITILIIAALPMLMAITLHEAAHAYAAFKCGDATAALAGRVSLNPLVHIDPVGTVLIPGLMLLVSGGTFAFGYAKPVPVNFARLRNPKRDMRWVAAAGPLANLAMAIAWLLLHKQIANPPESQFADALLQVCAFGVTINLVLMLLNLLPLPPLDGGRIVTSLLPMRLAIPYAKIEPYGIIILLLLLISGILGKILEPLLDAMLYLLQTLF